MRIRPKPFIVSFLLSAVAFPALADSSSAAHSVAMNVVLKAIENLGGMLADAGRAVIFAILGFWAIMVILDKLGLYHKFDRFMSSTRFAERREYLDFRERYFEEQRRRYEERRQLREQRRADLLDAAWADYKNKKVGYPTNYYASTKRYYRRR